MLAWPPSAPAARPAGSVPTVVPTRRRRDVRATRPPPARAPESWKALRLTGAGEASPPGEVRGVGVVGQYPGGMPQCRSCGSAAFRQSPGGLPPGLRGLVHHPRSSRSQPAAAGGCAPAPQLARPTGPAAGRAVLAHRVGVAVAAGVGAHLDGVHALPSAGGDHRHTDHLARRAGSDRPGRQRSAHAPLRLGSSLLGSSLLGSSLLGSSLLGSWPSSAAMMRWAAAVTVEAAARRTARSPPDHPALLWRPTSRHRWVSWVPATPW